MEYVNFSPYLRLIQKTGSTKHPGGLFASDLLLKRMGLKKTSRLLDVGCGAGHTSAHIAKTYGCLVTGIDISSDVLQKASALYKREPYFEKMNFEQGDASSLPFSDGYFDVVLCESVLVFINDKEAAIKEMERVLKPGGYLALNELCISDKKGLQKIKDYFLRPEFGGFLTTSKRLSEPLMSDAWDILVEDEKPLDIKDQLKAEITELLSVKGILQLFEFAHLSLTNQDVRTDLFRVISFAMGLPKGTIDHLSTCLLLAQKKTA